MSSVTHAALQRQVKQLTNEPESSCKSAQCGGSKQKPRAMPGTVSRALAGAMLLLSLPALAAFTGGRAPLLSGRVLPRAGARGTCMQSSGGGGGATDIFDMATLIGASLARPGAGAFVAGYRAEPSLDYKNPTMDLPIREFSETLPSIRPAKPLELYEYEACPFCRKVREAVSMLDLDVVVYPCPRSGTRYRAKVTDMGGKAQFPYLVDPNTKFASYESDRIIRYLFQTYGDGIVPLPLTLGPLTSASASLASAFRMGKGRQAKPGLPPTPAQPLEFWSYEASPFCRVVRERLCELELAHKVVTVARGSPKREQLVELAGKMQVPYLVDPNTGTQMFESADINAYLDRTYGPGGSSEAPAPASTPAPEEPPAQEVRTQVSARTHESARTHDSVCPQQSALRVRTHVAAFSVSVDPGVCSGSECVDLLFPCGCRTRLALARRRSRWRLNCWTILGRMTDDSLTAKDRPHWSPSLVLL